MGYVETVLQPGETLLYRGKLHWIIYVPGLSVGLLAILLVVGVFASIFDPFWSPMWIGVGVAPLCLIIAVLMLAAAWLKRRTEEIAVTDRRIILKTGLIARRTVEMNMDKVESVDVSQAILARLLDYGTVVIRGTGTGRTRLHDVAEPLTFRAQVAAR